MVKERFDERVCSYNRKMLLDGYSMLEASLYGLIRFATQDKDREFFASNDYLAEFFGCGKTSIKEAVNHLHKSGIIFRNTCRDGNRKHRTMGIVNRELYCPKLCNIY